MKAPRFKPVRSSKGWRLNIPATLAVDGKRSRRFFKSRDEAEGEARKRGTNFVRHGPGTRFLPPAKGEGAARAYTILEKDPARKTLLDAFRKYLNRHKMRLASVPFEV